MLYYFTVGFTFFWCFLRFYYWKWVFDYLWRNCFRPILSRDFSIIIFLQKSSVQRMKKIIRFSKVCRTEHDKNRAPTIWVFQKWQKISHKNMGRFRGQQKNIAHLPRCHEWSKILKNDVSSLVRWFQSWFFVQEGILDLYFFEKTPKINLPHPWVSKKRQNV